MTGRQAPADERVWRFVEFGGDCWPWTGGTTRNGYGTFHDGARQVAAHRYVYELLVGPIPAGLVIDHLCRVPACVNPDHLEPVTNAENVRRGVARFVCGREQTAKTSCPKGHLYSPENTYRNPQGHRQCRECARASWRASKRRKAVRDGGR